MKGKSYYGLLLFLITIGISSFNFYQHKQEERLLEFEGYEISTIEERVEALYTKDQTDIVEAISEEEFEALDQIFLDLQEKDLHKQNKNRIQDKELEFLLAREMHKEQKAIRALFDEGVVKATVKVKGIERLEEAIQIFKKYSVYYKRNMDLLTDGKDQLSKIKEAEEHVNSLLDEEGNFLEGVTQEDIDEALEHIEGIKNKAIREALAASLDGEIIEVEEEDEEEEEEIEEAEEVEEVEEPETTTTTRPWRPSRPTQREPEREPTQSTESESDDTGNNESGTDTEGGSSEEPKPEPKPEPDPDPEPTPDPDPEPDPDPDPEPEPEPEPEPAPANGGNNGDNGRERGNGDTGN